jgi:high affinity Mn2+ porin
MRVSILSAASAILLSAAPALGQVPGPEAPPPPSPWSLHVQATYQLQGHGGFDAPYEGTNSFQDRKETRGSFTATLFIGRRLWEGGEAFVNAELLAGGGISSVLGLAGPPNGETYRVDSPELKASLARIFLRQTWSGNGAAEPVENAQNQIAGRQSRRRLVLTAGKFSGTDIFDANTWSHDPRTQFNNWSLWANAAWDYPADTRGYTWGLALEAYRDEWCARLGVFMEPAFANGPYFDHDVAEAHGSVLEVQRDTSISERKGAVRVLAFFNKARMGSYREAVALAPAAPDVTATREAGRTKFGFGLNLEQALTDDAGIFLRLGWNDGKTEAWAFTEVERTVSLGASWGGAAWGRPSDRAGAGFAWNGIGGDHRAYTAAGGYGFMLGDGKLNYSAERVLDLYYSFAPIEAVRVSAELQRFWNLAFNRDRGPVTVVGARLHLEF